MKFCKIEGCDKPSKGLGWCSSHYARYYRTGNPINIPTTYFKDCWFCNSPFKTKKSNQKYCSKKCIHKQKYKSCLDNTTKKICVVCNKLFTPTKPEYLTCSHKCGCRIRTGISSFKQQEYICVVCNKIVFMTPKYRKQRVNVFCSMKCYKSWRSIIMKTEERNPTLNKGHSLKTKRKISELRRKEIRLGKYIGRQSTKGGRRLDLDNIYFRSTWEANYARILNYLNVKWEYEPKTFIFKRVTNNPLSYTPDFFIVKSKSWVEVKGYMDSSSRSKLKRFKQHYPIAFENMKIIVKNKKQKSNKFLEKIGIKTIRFYEDYEKQFKDKIPNWE